MDLLDRHLGELDQHIKELRRTRKKLAAMTDRARDLDPADCTDPIRCQTIAVGTRTSPAAPEPVHHRHHH